MIAQAWSEDTKTGCWNWLLQKLPNGYGKTSRGGHSLAHRWSYAKHIGPIPQGMTVDHLCFNIACVNPAHLRLLSMEDNRANQRSAMKTHCEHGHEFTEENTYMKPGSGRRSCRACNRDAVARYKDQRRSA